MKKYIIMGLVLMALPTLALVASIANVINWPVFSIGVGVWVLGVALLLYGYQNKFLKTNER